MNHSDKAIELFYKGYNCAQSFLGAYDDILPFDRDSLLRISSSFGGGVSRLREVCGAFSGICLALGILYSSECSNEAELKTAHYRRVQELAKQFKTENGSYLCYELLGIPHEPQDPSAQQRTDNYYQSRPCAEIISKAAYLFDRYLETHPFNYNKGGSKE